MVSKIGHTGAAPQNIVWLTQITTFSDRGNTQSLYSNTSDLCEHI